MNNEINIYCDESCYLPNDDSPIMVIGGISCPAHVVRDITSQIFKVKAHHNVYKYAEAKWVKVSPSKIDMFKDLVDVFFDNPELHFRAVIATGKKDLSLKDYSLSYDDWYQRIYYLLLKEMMSIEQKYSIYCDIKDTKGDEKTKILKDVLNHTLYDFYDETVKRIQLVRSDQIQIMQLVDLLIGAISYKNRALSTSQSKLELIDYIEERSGRPLSYTTPRSEDTFNLFRWVPRVKRNDL